MMKWVNHVDLIGYSINKVTYIREKERLIFSLNNGFDVMIKLPTFDFLGRLISENNLSTKNRKKINISTIKDVTIKDIGWEGIHNIILYLFIIDSEGNMFRFFCDRTGNSRIYNYTDYLNQKLERKAKLDKIKSKLSSVFNKDNKNYLTL